MPYWNDKEYKTFEDIKLELGKNDSETIYYIEMRLDHKYFFAYEKRNLRGDVLVKYEELNNLGQNKLPYASSFNLWKNSKSLYPNGYRDADSLMFFEEELAPRDLILLIEASPAEEKQGGNTSQAKEQEETAQDFVVKLKKQGIVDKEELAFRVDETFTGGAHLTHHAMGKLLSEPTETLAPDTYKDRGRKWRGLK